LGIKLTWFVSNDEILEEDEDDNQAEDSCISEEQKIVTDDYKKRWLLNFEKVQKGAIFLFIGKTSKHNKK